MKKFYLTTAIDYANGHPHIGHAYEKILADVICRTKRLLGYDVHFLTGLDEHGQKVEQTAKDRGVSPQMLCDSVAKEFIDMCALLHISYDDYIRTTQPRHRVIVRDILQKLFDRGDIYRAEYTGFYSTRVERFLQEKDKVNGIWPESEFGQINEITEINYFFKLNPHKQWLVDYITAHEDFIFPKFRAKQVLEFLKEDINDLCISRPKNRLSWGIELPFDSEYVTYVWFDALINYISAVCFGTEKFSEFWPVDYHVIGKDILVPAHAIYWPIILRALDLPMPKTFLVHGWWLCSGEKMSKSVGNVVDPLDYAKQFGADAFRYFVIREMAVGQDSDFSHELFVSRYNNDLGNDLGNLVSRNNHMLQRYCGGTIP
ncbi:MAG: class I tRNA ligase family protein [Puniceicoccales bacterium]|jgi:methionyl-tRNA synthetase|nr:class I tRNA ligase family protein [Puniceicoccales bacterium]